MNIPINLVFEDELSGSCMVRLINCFDGKYLISDMFNGGGCDYIKTNIKGFYNASKGCPFFVLTDLDDYKCPVSLINDWIKYPKRLGFIFRVAVREVEAWLLADIDGFAEFTGVSISFFPQNPELEKDPKRKLIEIVKRSRKRSLKEDILPLNQNAVVGPNYNGKLMEFVQGEWDIKRAIIRSNSLGRAYKSLEVFEYVLRVK